MASLTDTAHRMDGHTVLYVPDEGLEINIEIAVKNKELVQRLEGYSTIGVLNNFYHFLSIKHKL